jgi:hypothetical protein
MRPCRAVPCRAVPCRAVPCRAVPCRAVPCRAVLVGRLQSVRHCGLRQLLLTGKATSKRAVVCSVCVLLGELCSPISLSAEQIQQKVSAELCSHLRQATGTAQLLHPMQVAAGEVSSLCLHDALLLERQRTKASQCDFVNPEGDTAAAVASRLSVFTEAALCALPSTRCLADSCRSRFSPAQSCHAGLCLASNHSPATAPTQRWRRDGTWNSPSCGAC